MKTPTPYLSVRYRKTYSSFELTHRSNISNVSFIEKVKQIIEENIEDETFGILNLCKTIGYSRAQLHNKIKAATGLSTSIFIRSIRLQKAKYLLHHFELNVSEVAYQVGFKNTSYFSRLFKEYFGKCPSDSSKTLTINHLKQLQQSNYKLQYKQTI